MDQRALYDVKGFKAEYGHSSGGVMTFVSKSGKCLRHVWLSEVAAQLEKL